MLDTISYTCNSSTQVEEAGGPQDPEKPVLYSETPAQKKQNKVMAAPEGRVGAAGQDTKVLCVSGCEARCA